jgi:hypothetical protein
VWDQGEPSVAGMDRERHPSYQKQTASLCLRDQNQIKGDRNEYLGS